MKFWDSSALVPLLVEEPATSALLELRQRDPVVVVWWGSEVECASAIARLERENLMTAAATADAVGRLHLLARSWHEIQPVSEIREVAVRLLRVHPLRAADALQLAAAFVAAERRPPTLEFLTLDDRLAQAAGREGFEVVAPAP
jgi:predicted nucleic acid-binding protein